MLDSSTCLDVYFVLGMKEGGRVTDVYIYIYLKTDAILVSVQGSAFEGQRLARGKLTL